MNPILFNIMILLAVPQDQMNGLELQASIYDISIESLIELYVLDRLDVNNIYVEVQKVEKEED